MGERKRDELIGKHAYEEGVKRRTNLCLFLMVLVLLLYGYCNVWHNEV